VQKAQEAQKKQHREELKKAQEVQKKQAQHKRIHNPTAWREDMAQKLNNLLETAGLNNNAALNDDDGITSS
jgi:sensor domain CHASE-containing protein